MNKLIEELADVLTPVSERRAHSTVAALPKNLQPSYLYFLSLCDGGYTPDGFIHFFGLNGDVKHMLLAWNEVGCWKRFYSLDENAFVFAEDIFGHQYFFDIRGNRKVVKMLLPSTGRTSLYTNSFDDFVEKEALSVTFSADARRLARQFMNKKSVMNTHFIHISCKKPVLLGGNERDLENLEVSESLANLVLTGQIVEQVKNLPRGTRIDSIRVEK